jgi:hypothetical protein
MLVRYRLPPPPDPSLEPFDGGIGVLSRGGVRAGHVATVRGQYHGLFGRQWKWWIWYLVVWEDGTRERPQEDYEPFLAVQELRAGYLDVDFSSAASRSGRYDVVWLTPDEAAATRERLGIRDSDF